ncbi:hypothetical protein BDV96DRAFT_575358 [Lophiotrema nucula]|uniref:Uncharacterized protein n=1 Tax=Lophiotrema nucula TaxID=690887 RepID=A0A6A5Z7E6_9PLEO|nr:hypothetical protein BDV96DRAFT_575358 [Lophiotrema nucula]
MLINSHPAIRERRPDDAFTDTTGEQGISVFLNVDPPPSSTTTNNPALRPASGENPQATILGLPLELRLEIYDHLYPSHLTHVSTTGGARGLGTICTGNLLRLPFTTFTFASNNMAPLRLFWRPCICPNQSLSTCSKPPWSGLCSPEEHCSTANCPIRYDFNIAATCKTLRREVLNHVLMRVSMSTRAASTIFKAYASDFLVHIQHLTLTPDELYSESLNKADVFDPSLLSIHKLMPDYPLSSLQSVTMQRRVATKTFRTVSRDVRMLGGREYPGRYDADPEWLSNWRNSTFGDVQLPKAFPVPIFAEFWAVLRPQDRDLGLENDRNGMEMLCIRRHIPPLEPMKCLLDCTAAEGLEISRQKVTHADRKARWKTFWLCHVDGFESDLLM